MEEPLGAGAEIAGYRVERELGRGGMGIVYLATQERLGRGVALKLIFARPGAATQPFRERFVGESTPRRHIEHPNAVPVYEAGEYGGEGLFIAMRYVEGSDLRAAPPPRRAGWSPGVRPRFVEGVSLAPSMRPIAAGSSTATSSPANILIGEVGDGSGPT